MLKVAESGTEPAWLLLFLLYQVTRCFIESYSLNKFSQFSLDKTDFLLLNSNNKKLLVFGSYWTKFWPDLHCFTVLPYEKSLSHTFFAVFIHGSSCMWWHQLLLLHLRTSGNSTGQVWNPTPFSLRSGNGWWYITHLLQLAQEGSLRRTVLLTLAPCLHCRKLSTCLITTLASCKVMSIRVHTCHSSRYIYSSWLDASPCCGEKSAVQVFWGFSWKGLDWTEWEPINGRNHDHHTDCQGLFHCVESGLGCEVNAWGFGIFCHVDFLSPCSTAEPAPCGQHSASGHGHQVSWTAAGLVSSGLRSEKHLSGGWPGAVHGVHVTGSNSTWCSACSGQPCVCRTPCKDQHCWFHWPHCGTESGKSQSAGSWVCSVHGSIAFHSCCRRVWWLSYNSSGYLVRKS